MTIEVRGTLRAPNIKLRHNVGLNYAFTHMSS